ncbi:hypothetical protein PTSG_04697 [Salpingoeca rosetta]|uniref:Uncharacterized protein n=1 Tax=Salpingoeca rosetta (strain ATCC 50818 / BSB-021) TaxID=946362 RepID=F2U862_SALR5|nr:uncharacterized protein PTSG_04697 [Salpingoeca rosetta]EGD72967.1 hypothetical protein PTSG_04697 [Salpingoeca rosetta]|eukprot:XP_004994789.1 hypothetical protein PTSG_04697 [Salpingoeca rosetta]
MSVTTDRSTSTTDTTTLGELLHGGCKWNSGVAVDNGLFLPRHFMQLAIHLHRRSSRNEFHHRGGLHVSMPLFSMVTFIHAHRSSDAFHPHKQEIPRHLQAEEEFNKYTYTELALPRVLRSIPDEEVEMMQRRVVFVFEEFFKSLSTQVHTALESARINLFSGDNAGKMQVQGLAYGTPNDTPHDVMQESAWCNTPAHRRKAAKDNTPM